MAIVFDCLLDGWLSHLPEHLVAHSGDSWQEVQVKQRAQSGYFLRALNGDDRTFTFLENSRTHQLYLIDRSTRLNPDSVNAIKCLAIAILGNFLHFSGTILWNSLKIPFDIGSIYLNTLIGIVRDFQDHSVWLVLKNHLSESAKELKESVTDDCVKMGSAFYYALGIEIAAIEGIFFDSLKAMANIALIEKAWNGGLSYHHDVRQIKQYPNLLPRTFFASPCFQPRGNLALDRVDGDLAKWELAPGNGQERALDPEEQPYSLACCPIFSFWNEWYNQQPQE